MYFPDKINSNINSDFTMRMCILFHKLQLVLLSNNLMHRKLNMQQLLYTWHMINLHFPD